MRGVPAVSLVLVLSVLAGCIDSSREPEQREEAPLTEPVEWIVLDPDGSIEVHGTDGLLVPIEVPQSMRPTMIGWSGSPDSTWMVLPLVPPSSPCAEQDPLFFIDGRASAREWGTLEAGRHILVGHMRQGSSFLMTFGQGDTVEVHEPIPIEAVSGVVEPSRVLGVGELGWEWGPLPVGEAMGFAFAATSWGSVQSEPAENRVSVATDGGACAESIRPDPSGASVQPIVVASLNGTTGVHAAGRIDGYADILRPPAIVAGHFGIEHQLWERLLVP